MHPSPTETEYTLPLAEALLAATLALMTGHAQTACHHQRRLMAFKIRANLFKLAEAADITPSFRMVVQRVQGCWETLALDSGDLLPERRLWHTAATRVQ